MRAPTAAQLTKLAHTIARRVGQLLEREGLLERDTEQLHLSEVLDADDPMPDLIGHSITQARLIYHPFVAKRCQVP